MIARVSKYMKGSWWVSSRESHEARYCMKLLLISNPLPIHVQREVVPHYQVCICRRRFPQNVDGCSVLTTLVFQWHSLRSRRAVRFLYNTADYSKKKRKQMQPTLFSTHPATRSAPSPAARLPHALAKVAAKLHGRYSVPTHFLLAPYNFSLLLFLSQEFFSLSRNSI